MPCIFLKWQPFFDKFLNIALLSTRLSLKPLYLAQLCTYTGAMYKNKLDNCE